MPISALATGMGFGPEDLQIIVTAFEDALRQLKLTDRLDPMTELVAHRILRLARQGERDPIRLRDGALRAIMSDIRDT